VEMAMISESINPGKLDKITSEQWTAIASQYNKWRSCSTGLIGGIILNGRKYEGDYLKNMAKIILFWDPEIKDDISRVSLNANQMKELDALAGAGNFFKALVDELHPKISEAHKTGDLAKLAELDQILLNTIMINYAKSTNLKSNPTINEIRDTLYGKPGERGFFDEMKTADQKDQQFEFNNASRNRDIAKDPNGIAQFPRPLKTFLEAMSPNDPLFGNKDGASIGVFIALLKKLSCLKDIDFYKLGRKEMAILLRYAAQEINKHCKGTPVSAKLIEETFNLEQKGPTDAGNTLHKLGTQLVKEYPDLNIDQTSWVEPTLEQIKNDNVILIEKDGELVKRVYEPSQPKPTDANVPGAKNPP